MCKVPFWNKKIEKVPSVGKQMIFSFNRHQILPIFTLRKAKRLPVSLAIINSRWATVTPYPLSHFYPLWFSVSQGPQAPLSAYLLLNKWWVWPWTPKWRPKWQPFFIFSFRSYLNYTRAHTKNKVLYESLTNFPSNEEHI